MMDDFYRQFEERFRGSRESIKKRLEVYLPLIGPLKTLMASPVALDLGCGRGEWLELLGENGFRALGVDQDAGMLAGLAEQGLHAVRTDALAYLRTLPDASAVLVSGFHIAEHLEFEDLLTLIRHVRRILIPGGLLILETPNPENLSVGANTFYTDPTHRRPLPPALLSFLPDFCGFARSTVFRLNGPQFSPETRVSLFDVITGASPDYAVVAQTPADPAVLALFDTGFFTRHGVSMDELALRYARQVESAEAQIAHLFDKIDDKERMIVDLSGRLDALNSRLDTLSAEFAGRFEAVAAELGDVYASRSWKITSPLRWGVGMARVLRAEAGVLRGGCKERLKQALLRTLRRLVGWARSNPAARSAALRIAHRFPALAVRIKKRLYDPPAAPVTLHRDTPLSPRAERIYQDLKRSITSKGDR